MTTWPSLAYHNNFSDMGMRACLGPQGHNIRIPNAKHGCTLDALAPTTRQTLRRYPQRCTVQLFSLLCCMSAKRLKQSLARTPPGSIAHSPRAKRPMRGMWSPKVGPRKLTRLSHGNANKSAQAAAGGSSGIGQCENGKEWCSRYRPPHAVLHGLEGRAAILAPGTLSSAAQLWHIETPSANGVGAPQVRPWRTEELRQILS